MPNRSALSEFSYRKKVRLKTRERRGKMSRENSVTKKSRKEVSKNRTNRCKGKGRKISWRWEEWRGRREGTELRRRTMDIGLDIIGNKMHSG